MRKMMYLFCSFSLLFIHTLSAQELKIITDKDDAVYHVNTQAIFSISCAKPGDIEYVLTNDGRDELKKGIIHYTDKEINIPGALNKPGFLLCSVTYTPSDGKEKQKIAAGAAFEPDKIKPAIDSMPPDFDEFWQRKKKKLSVIPLNPVLTPEKTDEPGIVMYDVKVDCLGPNPVRGYYAKPRNAGKGACPAIAIFQGAGVYSARKDRVQEFSREGFIAFENNAHGILNGQPRKYYAELDATTLKGYKYIDRDNPDKAYMMFMFLLKPEPRHYSRLGLSIRFAAQPVFTPCIIVIRGKRKLSTPPSWGIKYWKNTGKWQRNGFGKI
ncbi:acetylxylan esterase [Candidatus Sumerlaeota bacterium]|nr:acetylxylan esterase [Candidatus Sumerlaeota bacterium]